MAENERLGTCSVCGKPANKLNDEGIGSTCAKHQGILRRNADEASEVPNGWLRMSDVCRKAVLAGLKVGQLVKASGGDACTDPLLDPIFRVTYVGRGKYMNPEVLTTGFKLLLNKHGEALPQEPKPSKQEAEVSAVLKQAVKK